MPPAARLGDLGLGHGSFPPTSTISGSGDKFINNMPAHRVGDALMPHGSPSPSPPHGRATSAGSSKVITNGKPQARISDAIGCGGLIATGSGNTFYD